MVGKDIMKKTVALILTVLLIFSLAGCQSKAEKLYDEAQTAFQNGDYRKTVDIVTEIKEKY